MTNEEQFKKSVKQLLDEPQYGYDADNWEEAAKLLEKDSKRRRFFFILFAGLGLAVLFSVSYVLFVPHENAIQADAAPAHVTADQQQQVDETAAPVNVQTKTTSNSFKIIANEPVKQIEASVKGAIQTKIIKPVKPQKQAPKVTQANTTLHPVRPVIPVAQHHDTTATDAPDNAKQNTLYKEPSTPDTKHPGILPLADIQKGDTITPVVKSDTLNTTMPSFPQDLLTVMEDQNNTVVLPESVAGIKDSAQVIPPAAKDTLVKAAPAVKQPDSLITAAMQPTVNNLPKQNYCYAEAGTWFNVGWQYKGVREAMGFNPYIGLSYLNKLNQNIAVSIGAYYNSTGYMKLDTKLIKSAKIVFGEENEVTAITPVTVNYLAVPLKLHYAIDEKQSITGGYSIGYLLDVQSKVDTYTERLNMQQNKSSYKTGGYVEGFKTFNSQLSLGYRRYLYKNLCINGELVYGLTDTRDNTFFDMRLKERLTGLRLTLTYDILKK